MNSGHTPTTPVLDGTNKIGSHTTTNAPVTLPKFEDFKEDYPDDRSATSGKS